MRVLGIDPGYERLGLAVLDGNGRGGGSLVWSTCVRTSPKTPHPERLAAIFDAVAGAIEAHQPSAAAVEKLFFSVNRKSALLVAEARGAILAAAARAKLDVVELSPQDVKIAVTGYGASDKKAVEKMVRLLVPSLGADAIDDEVDAVAAGLAALAGARFAAASRGA